MKKKSIIYYIGVFLIPIIIMLIHMALKSCYPFGENTFLLGDAEAQYKQFYKLLFDVVSEHKSLFFNADAGMGMDMYTNFWYYLSNPLTVVVLLLGKNNIELSMLLVMLCELSLCGVTANYFFRHSRVGAGISGTKGDLFCALCALSYALCDYLIAYQFNMMWLPCLVMAPLVMLGVERLVYDRKYKLYMISLFLCMIFNFYFSWFICLLSLIWYVDLNKGELKAGLKTFGRYAAASVFSAMCSAFVLVPCFFMISSKNAGTGTSLSEVRWDSFGNLGDFLQGFLWCHTVSISGEDMVVNNNYCGLFVLVLVVTYMFCGHISIGQRIKRAAELIILYIALNWAGAIYILHGFTVPINFNGRFAFILYLLLIITAFEGMSHAAEIRLRYIGAAAILFVLYFAITMALNTEVASILCYMGSAMIIAYYIICLCLLRRKSISYGSFVINILIVGALELIINPFVSMADASALSIDRDADVQSWEEEYAAIETEEGERKTSWLYDDTVLFYYSDTSLYSSAINSNIVNFFEELGLQYMNNGNCYTYRGTTPLTNMLFNVRYLMTNDYTLTSYGGFTEISEGLYEADSLVGFGYVLDDDVLTWDTSYGDPFQVQNAFTSDVMGVGDIFEEYVPENIYVDGQNCSIDDTQDGMIAYTNIDLSLSSYATVAISFEATADMDLYMYASDTNNSCYVIYVGQNEAGYCYRTSTGDMIHIGEVSAGEQVTAYIFSLSETLETGVIEYSFYSYKQEVMDEVIQKAKTSVLDMESYADTCISGTVDSAEDGILYLAMPYYDGWTAYVDGVEQDIVMIGDTMMGIPVTAGEHEIVLTYIPYGFIPGVIISICGICIIILIFIYKKIYNKKGKIYDR